MLSLVYLYPVSLIEMERSAKKGRVLIPGPLYIKAYYKAYIRYFLF